MHATLEIKSSAILGEGPVWDDEIQKLYWIDIKSKKVFRYDPLSKMNETWQLDQMVGCIVPTGNDTIVCALQNQLVELNTTTSEQKYLAPIEPDLPNNRSNDGKADASGRLWVGTLHLPGEKGHAGLYTIDANLKTVQHLDQLGMSNGLGWSPDNKKMFLIDTLEKQVLQFDFCIEDGSIINKKIIKDFNGDDASPDGMCVDAEGGIWIAFYAGKRVTRYDPVTGEQLQVIEVPAVNITCCCFGGKDLDTLYITTASEGLTVEQLIEYPDSGSVFSAKPGVKGLRANYFKHHRH